MEYFFRHPATPIHIRALSRLLHASPTGITTTVRQLEREGILTLEKAKHQRVIMIKANREGKLFYPLKRAYNLYNLYASGFLEHLINAYSRPACIVLFGSYARGEDTDESDIDIAIITSRNVQVS